MAEQQGTKPSARATLAAKATAQERQASNKSRAAEAQQDIEGAGRPADAKGLAAQAAAILRGDSGTAPRKPAQSQPEPDPDDDELPPDADGDPDPDGQRDPGDDDDDDQADEQPAGKPASLDEAAKALGMTRQEFNAIPVSVGAESMTLGELKAKLPELLKLDASRERLE